MQRSAHYVQRGALNGETGWILGSLASRKPGGLASGMLRRPTYQVARAGNKALDPHQLGAKRFLYSKPRSELSL